MLRRKPDWDLCRDSLSQFLNWKEPPGRHPRRLPGVFYPPKPSHSFAGKNLSTLCTQMFLDPCLLLMALSISSLWWMRLPSRLLMPLKSATVAETSFSSFGQFGTPKKLVMDARIFKIQLALNILINGENHFLTPYVHQGNVQVESTCTLS